jgi:general secretion pathway protein G
MDAIEKALEQYRLDTGHFPTQEQGLQAIVKKPANEPRWDGPYLKKDLPTDPWGRPFTYKIPGERGEFDLGSLGKDGAPGGTGEAADLQNN